MHVSSPTREEARWAPLFRRHLLALLPAGSTGCQATRSTPGSLKDHLLPPQAKHLVSGDDGSPRERCATPLKFLNFYLKLGKEF